MKYDYFIAYASSDYARAESLYLHLAAKEARVFLDKKNLRAGDDWDESLLIAQQASSATLVLVSSNSSDAYYQREEIANAIELSRKRELKHRVIPVLLEKNSKIPYGLRVKNMLNWFSEKELDRVCHDLLEIKQQMNSRNENSISVQPQLFNVPPSPLYFVGRKKEQEQILSHLVGKKRTIKAMHCITAINGWPGIGKSTLANILAFNDEIQLEFTDGVLWINLGQSPNLLSTISELGIFFNDYELLRSATITEATTRLREVIKKKSILFILDDVWNEYSIKIFQSVLGRDCSLLFTSRIPKLNQVLIANNLLATSVQKLSKSEAFDLMKFLAPRVVAQYKQEVTGLLEDLAYSPLEIKVAAGLLRSEIDYEWGIGELIEDIRTKKVICEAASHNVYLLDKVQNNVTIQQDFLRSVISLEDNLKPYFKSLVIFDSKPSTFSIEEVSALWGVEQPKTLLRQLIGYGLIERVGINEFQLHDLLLKVAQDI